MGDELFYLGQCFQFNKQTGRRNLRRQFFHPLGCVAKAKSIGYLSFLTKFRRSTTRKIQCTTCFVYHNENSLTGVTVLVNFYSRNDICFLEWTFSKNANTLLEKCNEILLELELLIADEANLNLQLLERETFKNKYFKAIASADAIISNDIIEPFSGNQSDADSVSSVHSNFAAAAVKPRIIGGVTANPSKHLYMAYLTDNVGTFWCGASVLNTRWVLTAANCVYLADVSSRKVVVGSKGLLTGGDSYRVVSIIWHEQFNFLTRNYDVGVLQTATPIVYSDKVLPVVLAATPLIEGAVAVVTGWGESLTKLQALNTTVVSRSFCQKLWSIIDITVQSTHMCTFVFGSGSCINDEGGPLTIGNMQFGILSNHRCAGPPDLYTDVSIVYKWIKVNTLV
ncbi:hypothetical protein RN001_011402 [Aquatica leii]|uniref:Peptidase S1 domain-containing protein n=1 Tax=Aquatica leii TaxID=1421715 RepID=A0AAN7S8Y0_9COLE|nr:hypothetical protein RN001_011402 [Aquatica leii]